MAEDASEQASSLETTSASLEEMSSMTKQNSENPHPGFAMAILAKPFPGSPKQFHDKTRIKSIRTA